MFTFQVHHNFPEGILRDYAPQINALFGDNPINPFNPNAAYNRTLLFESQQMADISNQANAGSGGNTPLAFGADLKRNPTVRTTSCGER